VRKAFTLLELVVATTVFAVVVAAAYALFDAGRGAASRAEARALLFQTARAALEALEDDLRGAVLPSTAFDSGFIGTNRGSGEAPLDEIELVAANAHVAKAKDRRIDLSKVTYWVETDPSARARGLVRERQAVLTPVTVYARRPENVEEVAGDVVGLDLRYFDGDWRFEWDSTTQYKLPKAVEVTVVVRGEWKEQEILERFTSRFYLPVAAETPERQP
jgi:type II secretion system protein J